jgi:hypothetical protein
VPDNADNAYVIYPHFGVIPYNGSNPINWSTGASFDSYVHNQTGKIIVATVSSGTANTSDNWHVYYKGNLIGAIAPSIGGATGAGQIVENPFP